MDSKPSAVGEGLKYHTFIEALKANRF